MSMRLLGAVSVALAVAVAAAVPVRAESADDAALHRSMTRAIETARSFRMRQHLAPTRSDAAAIGSPMVQMTFVAPDRLRQELSGAHRTHAIVTIGAIQYTQTDAGSWQMDVADGDAPLRQTAAPMLVDHVRFARLPDRTTAGVRVGVVRITSASGDDQPLTCLFDRATFLPRTCTLRLPNHGGTVIEEWDGWNDPANVVEKPQLER